MRGTLHRVAGRLAGPLRGARGAWSERAGLLLRLWDDAGRVGVGEASPLPGYSAEEPAACARALQVLCRAGQGGAQGSEVSAAAGGGQGAVTLAQVSEASAAVAGGGAAARCAVETALLDLLGQQQGIPLATLLRRGWPVAGGAAGALQLSALLTGEDGPALIAEARAALARGQRTVKIKIGKPPRAAEVGDPGARERAFAQELQALGELCAALGDAVALRLDANQSFTAAEAPARLLALRPLQPELVEEPLQAPTPAALAALAALGVPLALDESLQGELAAALISEGGCAAVVLKPMALGLVRCRELAALAQARGLGLVVTHLFDGPVALAMARALARSLQEDGARLLPCGLTRHSGLSAWPALALEPEEGGPGLGLALPAGWPTEAV